MSIKFRLSTLNIQFKQAQRIFEFDKQVTFFYGPTSVGKTSVLRLIDYCLGNELVVVPALKSELVSCALTIETESFHIVLERELGREPIRVTWSDRDGGFFSVMAPSHPAKNQPPIWGEKIFGISDLLFYFLGGEPVWVTQAKFQEDSELVRLSFRDLFWYCYLRQDQLDNDFFKLFSGEPWLYNKGRDVQRYLFGYHSVRLNELQKKLDDLLQSRRANKTAAEQLREFLEEFGYHSEAAIIKQIDAAQSILNESLIDKDQLRAKLLKQTYFADELRMQLRAITESINDTTEAISDSERLISEYVSLRAELLSSKLKLSRTRAAQVLIAEADFHSCPSCGNNLVSEKTSDDCKLCHNPLNTASSQPSLAEARVLSKDISDRTDELQDSINRHRKLLKAFRSELSDRLSTKAYLDGQLAEEMKNYDSIFVANSRQYEQLIAVQQERIENLRRLLKMPRAIEKLEKAVDDAELLIKQLRRQIADERWSFKEADRLVSKLESTYHGCLLETGVPGVTISDKIVVNRTTWVPEIWPNGDQLLKWDYSTAGAGGKTTLLKVCYALAFHIVAATEGLPMPAILMIDSVMKNLAGSENRQYVTAFYELLFKMAATTLRDHQLIIADSSFFGTERVEVEQIAMDSEPPLVPYYSGP